jgi:hypothetical protein
MGTPQFGPGPYQIDAWSFNRLITYEACNYRAKLEYLEKRAYAASFDKTAANRGNVVHSAAERYIRGDLLLLITELSLPPVQVRINEYRDAYARGIAVVEQDWGFNRDWQPTGWFDSDVWLRAKCDVVVDYGDVLEVADWKTGKRDGNEVKHTQQGLLYAIAAFIRYPAKDNVRIRFIYTDEGREKVHEHSRSVIMRMLPDWDKRARAMTSATAFPHKANKMTCRFCPYAPEVNGGDASCPYGVEVPRAAISAERRLSKSARSTAV